jgi:hypothetical protein
METIETTELGEWTYSSWSSILAFVLFTHLVSLKGRSKQK